MFLALVRGCSTDTPVHLRARPWTEFSHFHPSPPQGTHYDTSNDSGGECGKPTQARFQMPTPSHDQDKGWYSFNVGSVHVIMMDTEMECGPGSAQYAFFESDLAAVDRKVTPWVIFAGHRPMYYMQSTGSAIDSNFQQFEPLLMKHQVGLGGAGWGWVGWGGIRDGMVGWGRGKGWPHVGETAPQGSSVLTSRFLHQVDLVLWGHVHNALVTCPGMDRCPFLHHHCQPACVSEGVPLKPLGPPSSPPPPSPVYNGTCVKPSSPGAYDAPIHAVIGNGGQSLSGLPKTREPWDIYHVNEFGYSTITAYNATTLEVCSCCVPRLFWLVGWVEHDVQPLTFLSCF